MDRVLPRGRLAESLYDLSRETVWFAVLVVVSGIAWVVCRYPAIELAPLYIPVVCAASWSLGGRASYFIAILVATLAVVPSLNADGWMPPMILAAKAGVRVVCFVTVAAAINSFRQSFERERYYAHRDRMTGTLNKHMFDLRAGRTIEDAGHRRHFATHHPRSGRFQRYQ